MERGMGLVGIPIDRDSEKLDWTNHHSVQLDLLDLYLSMKSRKATSKAHCVNNL
jgi:hypothetical protein